MSRRASMRAGMTRRLRQARRWGWPAPIAAALLVAGALAVLVVVPRLERELAGAQAAADAARRLASRPLASGREPERQAADPIGDWRAALPAGSERQTRVAALLSLAAASGLVPKRVEFRFAIDGALGIARYRIVLPVTGRYDSIRRFIDSALVADPALLLDSVRLARASAQATEARAELGFSLLMRTQAAETREPGASPLTLAGPP